MTPMPVITTRRRFDVMATRESLLPLAQRREASYRFILWPAAANDGRALAHFREADLEKAGFGDGSRGLVMHLHWAGRIGLGEIQAGGQRPVLERQQAGGQLDRAAAGAEAAEEALGCPD